MPAEKHEEEGKGGKEKIEFDNEDGHGETKDFVPAVGFSTSGAHPCPLHALSHRRQCAAASYPPPPRAASVTTTLSPIAALLPEAEALQKTWGLNQLEEKSTPKWLIYLQQVIEARADVFASTAAAESPAISAPHLPLYAVRSCTSPCRS
jgi:hypothetical protein